MQQDFFDFDEFDPPPRRVRKKRHRGKLFIFLGICIAIVAGLGTVLGIFRSNDTYLGKDLRKTFSIQPPPAPELPQPEARSHPSAGTTTPVSAPEKRVSPTIPAGHTPETENHPGERKLSQKPIAQTSGTEIHTAQEPAVAPPQVRKSAARPQIPAQKISVSTAASGKKATAAAVAGQPTAIEKGGGERAAEKTRPPETAQQDFSKTASLPPADLIAKGELTAAAEQYRQSLLKRPRKYAISLEVACRRETVIRAFKRAGPGSEIFILSKKVRGKSCFAVLWGHYGSIDAAKKGKTSIPNFFRANSSTPRIVALHPMLQRAP